MRKGENRDAGSIAVTLLIVLAFVAVLVAGVLVLETRWYANAASAKRVADTHRALDAKLASLIAELKSDPSPSSDSLTDPVFSWITSQSPVRITLEDASSRIDPNWIRRDVFDLTTLRSLFTVNGEVTGSPSAYLQQIRFDHGFHTDLATGYGMLFSPETISRYLTPWGYANINVTDEFALEKLYAVRTGDSAAAEVFHTKIQNALRQKRIIPAAELSSFLGGDYEKLYPVINTLPWWNVNFLPELILRQILAYPPYKIKNASQRANLILSLRRSTAISPERLREIIGLPSAHVIYQYLGTTTWFWKVTIATDDDALDAILCRLPPGAPGAAGGSGTSAGDSGTAHFVVVSRRYTS